MSIQAAEISAILKEQIKNFGQEAEVAEVGRVLSVGDGIARVYGLDRRMDAAKRHGNVSCRREHDFRRDIRRKSELVSLHERDLQRF